MNTIRTSHRDLGALRKCVYRLRVKPMQYISRYIVLKMEVTLTFLKCAPSQQAYGRQFYKYEHPRYTDTVSWMYNI